MAYDIMAMLDREYRLQEKYEQSLPICDECKERITSERCLRIPDTDRLLCEDCGWAYIDDMWSLTDNYVG